MYASGNNPGAFSVITSTFSIRECYLLMSSHKQRKNAGGTSTGLDGPEPLLIISKNLRLADIVYWPSDVFHCTCSEKNFSSVHTERVRLEMRAGTLAGFHVKCPL
jgi:hypothetical protein